MELIRQCFFALLVKNQREKWTNLAITSTTVKFQQQLKRLESPKHETRHVDGELT